jgi:uncharacterized protein YndB with AHSA1/START domain
MNEPIKNTILIDSTPDVVWELLTNHDQIKQWIADPEMEPEIITEWKVNGPIIIRGFHHLKFENKGTVLQFKPNQILSYSHLSSVSRLPDIPKNYSIFEFSLIPIGNQTSLTITVSNFPTETIYKHLKFYWEVTPGIIKGIAEKK